MRAALQKALLDPTGLPQPGLVAAWMCPRVNLFKFPEALDNAAWTNAATTVATGQADPVGGTSAFFLKEVAITSNHSIYQGALQVGVAYVISVYVKANGRDWFKLQANTLYRNVNLSDGTTGNGSGITIVTENAGGGWWKCVASFTANGTAGAEFKIGSGDVANVSDSYAGDITKGIYLWHPQLNDGTLWPYDGNVFSPGLQSIYDLSGNGNHLQMGATANAEATDPVQTLAGLSMTGANYALSGNLAAISMAGEWTAYLCAKLTGSSNTPLSFADATAADQYVSVEHAASGSINVTSKSGASTATSSNLAVPTTTYNLLALRSASGVLSITLVDTLASVSVANQNPTGTPRLGIGARPASTVTSIANSMLVPFAAIYARATSSIEDQRVRRYLQRVLGPYGSNPL